MSKHIYQYEQLSVVLCFRLMFGFMVTALILSMWISNTATTAMMITIVEAVLDQLKRHLVVKDEENPEDAELYHKGQ